MPKRYWGAGDHPREYGENRRFRVQHYTGTGSSPRIRGEFSMLLMVALSFRIIPANTGRMPAHGAGQVHLADHPREYGENAAPRWAPNT